MHAIKQLNMAHASNKGIMQRALFSDFLLGYSECVCVIAAGSGSPEYNERIVSLSLIGAPGPSNCPYSCNECGYTSSSLLYPIVLHHSHAPFVVIYHCAEG
jgi:hypothetical protein